MIFGGMILIAPPPSLSQKTKEKFNIQSKIGIADVRSNGTGCLRTKNGYLTRGTPISIITALDEPPQKVLTASVKKKSNKSCARYASESGDDNPGKNFFYQLSFAKRSEEEMPFEVGIAVINPRSAIRIQNNLASIDLNSDGKPEFFRRCAGFEGILFSIWTGKPLEGKRIWHSFYYLDYDTEANCNKQELEETED